MKYHKVLLIFILCVFTFQCYSQETLKLKKGIINTSEGKRIQFSSLQQNGTEFLYTASGSSVSKTLNQKDILSISKKDGDHTILYGLIMGASGCLGAIIGANQSQHSMESQGMVEDKSVKRNTIITITGISFLAGAIWGAATPKYSRVYENPDYASRLLDHLNLSVSVGRETQLCIKYNF